MVEIPGIGKDLQWWLGLTGVSGVSLVAAIAAGWPDAAVIAAGFAGIGIGQWIDHPIHTSIRPGMKITRYDWEMSLAGMAFTVCGALAVLYGVVHAVLAG